MTALGQLGPERKRLIAAIEPVRIIDKKAQIV